MDCQPACEPCSIQSAAGNSQHNRFQRLHISQKPQTRHLVEELGVEMLTAKCLQGLSKSRFEKSEIPETASSSALLNQAAMQLQHFSKAEPTHQARRR